MENKDSTVYFSNHALVKFMDAQGKYVNKIVCHLWQNASNKNDVVEIIDNIDIQFADNTNLCIGCNEDSNGLDAIHFNFSETVKALEEEFKGKIKIFAVNASGTKMWKDVIGKKLEAVQITKVNDNYKADSLMLNFGEEKRVISINPMDGLLIDYYEE